MAKNTIVLLCILVYSLPTTPMARAAIRRCATKVKPQEKVTVAERVGEAVFKVVTTTGGAYAGAWVGAGGYLIVANGVYVTECLLDDEFSVSEETATSICRNSIRAGALVGACWGGGTPGALAVGATLVARAYKPEILEKIKKLQQNGEKDGEI